MGIPKREAFRVAKGTSPGTDPRERIQVRVLNASRQKFEDGSGRESRAGSRQGSRGGRTAMGHRQKHCSSDMHLP